MFNYPSKEVLHKVLKKVNIVHGIHTDVGKTYTTGLFINLMQLKFKENFAVKPIISGFSENNWQESDNYHLLSSFGIVPSFDDARAISRYIFQNPLSPDVASWREGIEIDFDEVITFCRNWIAKLPSDGRIFIEMAGGVCTPASNFHTMADISRALCGEDCCNILVARPYLGAISHTLSSLNVLKFDVLAFNQSDENFRTSVANHLKYDLKVLEV